MTPQTRTSLKELQQLDQEIAAVRAAALGFEPLLDEVDAPVLRLEQDVHSLEKRLTEIRLEEKRIELTIEERRVRADKLQGRMEAVRNVREEAAVHAELEMVRRALEGEEQEALSLLDQINRLEERLQEQGQAYRESLAEVEPRRKELVQQQEDSAKQLEALSAKRDQFAAGIDPSERRIYDSIMAGSREVAVSELTQDGACGNCFNMVPLQVQNRIRHSDAMIRCEGCGVILTPESPEGLALAEAEGERIEQALKASTDLRDAERALISEAVAIEDAEEAESAAVIARREAALVVDDADDVLDDALEAEEVPSDNVPAGTLVFEQVAPDEAPSDESAVEAATPDDPPETVLVFEDVVPDEVPVDAPPPASAASIELSGAPPAAEENTEDAEDAEAQEPTADA
jgi:predicted  nucleic acid-binding Zn-ribbon protein